MEWLAFAASVLTAFLSFLGVYFSNKKQTALMDYRLQQVEENLKQMEKKIGVHNNFESRIVKIETKIEDMNHAS